MEDLNDGARDDAAAASSVVARVSWICLGLSLAAHGRPTNDTPIKLSRKVKYCEVRSDLLFNVPS